MRVLREQIPKDAAAGSLSSMFKAADRRRVASRWTLGAGGLDVRELVFAQGTAGLPGRLEGRVAKALAQAA